MGQLLFILVAALVVGAIVFGVAVVITGGDPGLEPAEPDGRAVPLPTTRPLAETDVGRARFDVALRGYRMAQVDQALARMAYDIGYKDELINVLESEIAALRAGRIEDAEVLRRAREASLTGVAPESSEPSDRSDPSDRSALSDLSAPSDRSARKTIADPVADLGLLTPPASDAVAAPDAAAPDVPAAEEPAAAAERSEAAGPALEEPALGEPASEEPAAEASPAAAGEPPAGIPAVDEQGQPDPTTPVPAASGEQLPGEKLPDEKFPDEKPAEEQEQAEGGKPVRDREPAGVDDAVSSRR